MSTILPETTPRVVCTIPTYDEAENISPLIEALLDLGPGYSVLVIDDDSPDGTWRLVQEMAAVDPRVELLHRTVDPGRGTSGRDGFLRALESGAEIIIEMDADFSHDPALIPDLVARLEGEDRPGLVLGSRGVPGGRDADRGFFPSMADPRRQRVYPARAGSHPPRL